MRDLTLPLDQNTIKSLGAGELITLTGKIYTARDAAHQRLVKLIKEKKQLPFNIKGAFIYYTGPCPARPGEVIGSCGPTTSSRMDAYAPALYDLGMGGAIGKGVISAAVKEAMSRNSGVYFLAVGGAGALISKCVKSCKIVAFEDLGAEAVHELEIEKLPLIVGVDANKNDIYEQGVTDFLRFKNS